MCLAVYVGADHPLPLKPWHKEKPRFYARALSADDKEIRNHFSVPHLRYVGTEEGCGCPFNYGRELHAVDSEFRSNLQHDSDALSLGQRSRHELVEYVRLNQVREIFSCWDGEPGKTIGSRRNIKVKDILEDAFAFTLGEMLTLED